MNTSEIIVMARKHAVSAQMQSSALVCLADAVALYDKGNFDAAKRRAIKSLAYSVGIFHKDYKRAAA